MPDSEASAVLVLRFYCVPMETDERRWAPWVVALLTCAWIVAVPALMLWLLAIGLDGWGEIPSESTAISDSREHKAAVVSLLLAVVAAGTPVLIAVIAFSGEMKRAGAVYLVLAIVLGVLVTPLAVNAGRILTPDSPPPAPGGVCQERSGGGNDCPGG